MNRILKFQPEENLYWTTDPHLNHVRDFVWQSRGHNSIEEHREAWIAKVNETLPFDAKLFLLGDFFLNSTPEMVDDVLDRVKCNKIYYLWGNHENPLQRMYRAQCLGLLGGEEGEVYPLRYKNLVFVGNYLQIFVGKQPIVMCHFPLRSWNDMKFGAWMLHGHEHNQVEKSTPGWTEGKILDVGWDEFKKPLSFSEIADIMSKKTIKSEGHH
jgi:calcineurin-like phosphoesterase family protein